MPFSEEEFNFLKAVTVLQTQQEQTANVLKRLEDQNEGTVERKGMKERVTLAEHEIAEHKKAWIKNQETLKEMEARISQTLREAFTESQKQVSKRMDDMDIVIGELKKSIEEPKTWIAKIQPYVSIVGWVLMTIASVIIINIVSGNWQIVRTP